MNLVEITGQPCSGKSTLMNTYTFDGIKPQVYKQGLFLKLINFIRGLIYLRLKIIHLLLSWSLKEQGSFAFRMNIFRNAVSKFGIFVDLKTNYIDSRQTMIVDEGISHLPFLFQNTETHFVLELLTSELSDIEVIFLPNPGSSTIKERLKSRGHKRLKYLNVDSFMSRNRDIECYLIDQYPHLSKNLIIFGDD